MIDKSTYVFFRLYGELFAIDVKNVVETMEMVELTPVPETPNFMKGVTIFRGNILPVICLRLKFKLEEAPDNQEQFIIVTKYEKENKKQEIGLVVDKIVDVRDLSTLDINDFPEIGSRYNLEFINGLVKHENTIAIILNIEKILSSVEIDMINKSTTEFDVLNDDRENNDK
ncbi:MAG: purine-binding chemotaxis protein CheW [Bacteroidales bacterium]|nr:purine-binding chemotaxis protein CheW [Bacteroidales bacterium]